MEESRRVLILLFEKQFYDVKEHLISTGGHLFHPLDGGDHLHQFVGTPRIHDHPNDLCQTLT